MIYRLNKDFENTYSLLIDGTELYSKMPTYSPRFFATVRAANWVKPEGSFYRSENFKGNDGAIPNITLFATGVLVFDVRAHGALVNELAPCGEFLPALINGDDHYLLNPLYVIPDEAVDCNNAVEKVDAGVHLGQGNVSFDEEFLNASGIMVFKTKIDKLIFSYCTQQFKDRYEALNLAGLIFEPVEPV